MTTTMGRALWGLAIVIIIGGGIYYFAGTPVTQAPVPAAPQAPAVQTSATTTPEKPPADVGAGGVYDPNAPQGSSAQCAACGQYSGVQKAQCLAALNCQ